MDKRNILYIKLLNSSFIKKDEELLSKNHLLTAFQFNNTNGLKLVIELFREFGFLCKNIKKSDLVFVWFADFHAVLPVIFSRLFGKKSIIVIGGVDAAYIPEMNYGTKTKLLGRISVYFTTKWADQLLPVTNYTYHSLITNISGNLKPKCNIIYNCFSSSFEQMTSGERKNQMITVCLSNKVKTLYVKSVDFYIELARAMPDYQFLVVGVSGEALHWLKENSPCNVVIIEPVTHEKLGQLYHSSKVICQFSRQEAFGVALLEGIAAGCYPVGFNQGGTKEILTKGVGLVIDKLDVAAGVQAIDSALKMQTDDQQKVKEDVLKRFTCEKRLIALNKSIANLL